MPTLSFVFCWRYPCRVLRVGDSVWPGWLGPERNGRVKGFDPPAQWPVELKPKWSVQVGSGYGTAVVSEGKVMVHLDRVRRRWFGPSSLFPARFLDQGLSGPVQNGRWWGAPRQESQGQLAYSDGRLFTTSITGILSAWDADSGKLLWRKIPGKRFGLPYAHWGATNSSPILGDRIINLFGNG